MPMNAWLSSLNQSLRRNRKSSGRRASRRSQRRLLLENLEHRRVLAAGVLDPSFGQGGLVTTNFIPVSGLPGWSDVASSVALQGDGKIVVAGTLQPNGAHRVAMSRYNSDGSLDKSFGTDGKLVDLAIWSARDVAIQTDGKIVIAGGHPKNFAGSSGIQGNFSVGRYLTNGSPDTSFGKYGYVITNQGIYDEAHAVTLLNDGRLLVVGQSGQPGPEQPVGFALQMFNVDGSADTTFGVGGRVRTFFTPELGAGYGGQGNVAARDVVLQPDGKIVVAGNAIDNKAFAVARYHSDGSLDTSFQGDGRVADSFGTGTHIATSVALQKDGKIVVAGHFRAANSSMDIALLRYNTDGSLDNTFDGDGKLTIDYDGLDDLAIDIAVQKDGQIIVTGQTGNNLLLARLNPDGTHDTSFGTNGRTTTTVQKSAWGSAVAVQPDGNIVVAGTTMSTYPNPFHDRDFVVARYGGTPTNTPPVLKVAAAAVRADEGSTVSNSGTFFDAQGNDSVSLTVTVDGTPFGTLIKNDELGTWSWSADAGDGPAGPITVTISANDGKSPPVSTSFTYSVDNLDPDAVDDVFSVFEKGASQILDLLGNDSDPAGSDDPLSITGVDTTGTVGQVTFADGVVSYSPAGRFNALGVGEWATDTFTYSISDGDGGSDTATVKLTIVGQNDAPTATGTLSDLTVNQNAADTIINLTGLFHDVDTNDVLTITAVSSSSGLVTASISGNSLTLDYQPNQHGTAAITVTGTDSSGESVSLTFNLIVRSPAQIGQGIIQLIRQWQSDGKINHGIANSMIVKVENSLKSYDMGNIADAGDKLNALKNQIKAKTKPRELSSADAELAFGLIDELFASMLA